MAKKRTDWTVLSMLEWATEYFESKGVNNPRLSIEWLLAHELDKKRLDLYLIFDKPLSSEVLENLRPLIKRRSNHEPLQYIIGETDFYGLPFKVQPGVLIPRQETEQLIELVLNEYSQNTSKKLLDIGTGSGCIPVTIKKKRNNWDISAFDVSVDALDIARENATLNNVEIDFYKDDLLNPSITMEKGNFDIIISNPPYILNSEKNSIDEEVKNFEPEIALFTSSIKNVYGAIEQIASKLLTKSGLLTLEINEQFGAEILGIFPAENWDATLLKDYAKKDRFLVAKKMNSDDF